MRSSFFGLNVAVQGLFTAQTALDVTNHNISNVETPGYSRQYAVQKASRPLPNFTRGMVGTGSEIIDIKQYRNSYIDKKYWDMNTDFGQYSVKSDMLSQLELLFNEPSDSGYNASLNELFTNLQSFSTNPSEPSVRSNFIDSMDSFAKYFNNLAEQLGSYQRDANFGVKVSVEEINSISTQLATLNNQIANMELGGISANDLRDERVALVDRLSKIVNIETNESVDINGKKKFEVTISGQSLVDGTSANLLEVRSRATLNNVEDEADLYDVYWTSGKKLYLNNDNASGELKGYLDVRDGNNKEIFKGNIQLPVPAGPPYNVVIQNINTTDIPASGTLMLGNTPIKYTGYTYTGGTNITFTLTSAVPATATTAQIGEEVNFKGIPYYTRQLNEFVRTVAKEFNSIHKTGGSNTGIAIFSTKYGVAVPLDEANDHTYNQITIDNFACSKALLDNNSLLMTSKAAGAGESANDLLLQLLDLKHDTTMFSKGEPDNYMQALIGELGISAKQNEAFRDGQENLLNLIDQQKKSISSVDMNEEVTDMLRFQQAYTLSAKMISVMDEVYDVMINQLVR